MHFQGGTRATGIVILSTFLSIPIQLFPSVVGKRCQADDGDVDDYIRFAMWNREQFASIT